MEHTITIYSTPSCVYCKMAKKFLDEHGFVYKDINVAQDLEGREEMFTKSQQKGVPVIQVDDTIIVGFDKKNLETLLF